MMHISKMYKHWNPLNVSQISLDYKIECTIASGSFSRVKKAKIRRTGAEVVVKVISLECLKNRPKAAAQVEREIAILKLVDHGNCVRLLDSFEGPSRVNLVFEMLSGGTLQDRIYREKIPEEEAAQYHAQIMQALEYLHTMCIVHRDVKPDNIMFETAAKDSPLKLIDFGLGRFIAFDGDLMSTLCGTPAFVPPEVIVAAEHAAAAYAAANSGGHVASTPLCHSATPGDAESCCESSAGAGYGPSCDIWSAGVVLYRMLSGALPFDDTAPAATVLPQIRDGRVAFPPEAWAAVSPRAAGLARLMLEPDPRRRPSAADCLADPWCATARRASAASAASTASSVSVGAAPPRPSV